MDSLNNGQSYDFEVRAVNSDGPGDVAEVRNVTPRAPSEEEEEPEEEPTPVPAMPVAGTLNSGRCRVLNISETAKKAIKT